MYMNLYTSQKAVYKCILVALGLTSALGVSVTSESFLLHQHSKRGKGLSEP